jgi:hypothetical protein
MQTNTQPEIMCIKCKITPATPPPLIGKIEPKKPKQREASMYCDKCRERTGLSFYKPKKSKKAMTVIINKGEN